MSPAEAIQHHVGIAAGNFSSWWRRCGRHIKAVLFWASVFGTLVGSPSALSAMAGGLDGYMRKLIKDEVAPIVQRVNDLDARLTAVSARNMDDQFANLLTTQKLIVEKLDALQKKPVANTHK